MIYNTIKKIVLWGFLGSFLGQSPVFAVPERLDKASFFFRLLINPTSSEVSNNRLDIGHKFYYPLSDKEDVVAVVEEGDKKIGYRPHHFDFLSGKYLLETVEQEAFKNRDAFKEGLNFFEKVIVERQDEAMESVGGKLLQGVNEIFPGFVYKIINDWDQENDFYEEKQLQAESLRLRLNGGGFHAQDEVEMLFPEMFVEWSQAGYQSAYEGQGFQRDLGLTLQEKKRVMYKFLHETLASFQKNIMPFMSFAQKEIENQKLFLPKGDLSFLFLNEKEEIEQRTCSYEKIDDSLEAVRDRKEVLSGESPLASYRWILYVSHEGERGGEKKY